MKKEYRKSRFGVYPDTWGWRFKVVGPDGYGYGGGYDCREDAYKAARKSARWLDRIERDRVDGVESVTTDKVLESGVRQCERCGKPHDLLATTRRGRRFGQTWESSDCGPYYPESWEAFARKQTGTGTQMDAEMANAT